MFFLIVAVAVAVFISGPKGGGGVLVPPVWEILDLPLLLVVDLGSHKRGDRGAPTPKAGT